jgi:hypothetical protein
MFMPFPFPAAAFRRCGLALYRASAMPTTRTDFLASIQRLADSTRTKKVSADSSRTVRIATRASGDTVISIRILSVTQTEPKPIPGSTLRVAPE